MPSVSTQRLYLPCPAPPTGSWRANLADALDTSALAQCILARLPRAINICYVAHLGYTVRGRWRDMHLGDSPNRAARFLGLRLALPH